MVAGYSLVTVWRCTGGYKDVYKHTAKTGGDMRTEVGTGPSCTENGTDVGTQTGRERERHRDGTATGTKDGQRCRYRRQA